MSHPEPTPEADTADRAGESNVEVDLSRWQALEGGARYKPGPEDHDTAEYARQLVEPEDCCQSCGSKVSPDARRVFGDNQNVVWACFDCPDTNREGIAHTANTAGQERDVRDSRPGGGRR